VPIMDNDVHVHKGKFLKSTCKANLHGSVIEVS
jgi:hypothetical protein